MAAQEGASFRRNGAAHCVQLRGALSSENYCEQKLDFRKTRRDGIVLKLIGSLCKHTFKNSLFPLEWKDSWLEASVGSTSPQHTVIPNYEPSGSEALTPSTFLKSAGISSSPAGLIYSTMLHPVFYLLKPVRSEPLTWPPCCFHLGD